MALQTGSRLGAYEIRGPLGAGGMGEVYRAWDARLGREVAVKVLPPSSAKDPDRLRRFEQEARAAGALNHPNVLTVHDVGSHEASPYIVSELLEGDTLRGQIRAGGLTPRKAVECAVQIARGLAAAHQKGIVHRDLKPENVFLARDGHVKILDFGLAKLRGEGRSGPEDETATQETRPGVVLGTVPYLSPEQVRGLPADSRSDVFALGTVLYEMLARRRPFTGETTSEIETAILREEPPDLPTLDRQLPAVLDRIVRRCLEKRPEDRFESARDVAFALEAAATATGPAPTRDAAGRGRRRTTPVVIAALLLGLVLGGFLWNGLRPASSPPSYSQLTFRRGAILSARFSHDGQTVVYSAAWDGQPAQVFTTRIGSREARPLGLEGVVLSVSSKDEVVVKRGRFLGRRTSGQPDMGTLARVSLAGGAPRDLLENVMAADWDAEGRELAVLRRVDGRKRLEYPIGHVLAEGGYSPRTLPGGQVAFFEARDLDVGSVFFDLVSIDREGRKSVLSPGWLEWPNLTWSEATREILFVASRKGEEVGLHAVSLAGRERLVARFPGDFDQHDVDRRGRLLLEQRSGRDRLVGRLPGESQERDLSWLQDAEPHDLSADGRQLLVTVYRGPHSDDHDLVVWHMDGSPAVRLGEYYGRSLSPDGRWALAFPSGRYSSDHLVLVPTGAGEPRELRHASIPNFGTAAWYPDGRRIAIVTAEDRLRRRLFVWDIAMSAPPRALSPEGEIGQPVVSPDGRSVVASVAGTGLVLYPVDGGAGGTLRGGSAQDEPLRFTSDGRWLFVRRTPALRPDTARVWIDRIEMATGKREAWKELAPSDPAGMRAISTVHITSDGQSYVYAFGSTLGGLYLAEGLK
jgi:eukaryotic-like serine/threonine-protein kinase